MSQKISRQVINDIASGASNAEVCGKHGLDNAQVETVRRKLKAAGVVKDNGSPATSNGNTTQITTQSLWNCPACNTPQLRGYKECPQCGVLVEKYYNKQKEMEDKRLDALQNKRKKIIRQILNGATNELLNQQYYLTDQDVENIKAEHQQQVQDKRDQERREKEERVGSVTTLTSNDKVRDEVYPSLMKLSDWCYIMAWIFLVVFSISALGWLLAGIDGKMAGEAWFVGLLVTVGGGILTWMAFRAAGELIVLFIDIALSSKRQEKLLDELSQNPH